MNALNKIVLGTLFLCTLSMVSCEKKAPFDTQSPDDAPLILKPYNESGTGSFTYTLANDSTPLIDSVVVTPSRYTTVNWYVDDSLVHTGTKINMCFAAGKHTLLIEAVTTAGKRTTRTGTITVLGGAPDPSENVLWNGPVTSRCILRWLRRSTTPCVSLPLGGETHRRMTTSCRRWMVWTPKPAPSPSSMTTIARRSWTNAGRCP